MITAFWRRWLLPFTILPLLPATLFNLFAGREWALLGCLVGIALPMVATRLMRRGRAGDANRAALAMGASAGAVAFLGAEAGPVAALLLAIGAWGGTQLLYTGIAEAPEPVTVPPPPPEPEALRALRDRLGAISGVARGVGAPGLLPAVTVLGGVLDDLARRPERLAKARDLVTLHLDGLDRIVTRLAAGAEPPPGLPALLRDLEAAARDLRTRLRDEETAALAVQVKVIGDRLRSEGYG